MKSVAGNNVISVGYPIRAQLSLDNWRRVSVGKISANLAGITGYTTIKFPLSFKSPQSPGSKLKKI